LVHERPSEPVLLFGIIVLISLARCGPPPDDDLVRFITKTVADFTALESLKSGELPIAQLRQRSALIAVLRLIVDRSPIAITRGLLAKFDTPAHRFTRMALLMLASQGSAVEDLRELFADREIPVLPLELLNAFAIVLATERIAFLDEGVVAALLQRPDAEVGRPLMELIRRQVRRVFRRTDQRSSPQWSGRRETGRAIGVCGGLDCAVSPTVFVREFGAFFQKLIVGLFDEAEAAQGRDALARMFPGRSAAAFAPLAKAFIAVDGNGKRYSQFANEAIQFVVKKPAPTIEDFETLGGIGRPLILVKERNAQKVVAALAREAELMATKSRGQVLDRFIALTSEFLIPI
jgi:hypothetical protein